MPRSRAPLRSARLLVVVERKFRKKKSLAPGERRTWQKKSVSRQLYPLAQRVRAEVRATVQVSVASTVELILTPYPTARWWGARAREEVPNSQLTRREILKSAWVERWIVKRVNTLSFHFDDSNKHCIIPCEFLTIKRQCTTPKSTNLPFRSAEHQSCVRKVSSSPPKYRSFEILSGDCALTKKDEVFYNFWAQIRNLRPRKPLKTLEERSECQMADFRIFCTFRPHIFCT